MIDSKLAVYFDDAYPQAWIGYEEGRKMRDYFVSKHFKAVTAAELEIWMRNSLSATTTSQTCVVFAMDVIPGDIFGDVDGNVLFRRYLDSGGRIVWLGDIPTWYRGKPKQSNESREESREQVWQLGSFISLLGIAPIMANCFRRVQLTTRGEEIGLRSEWYSMRPIRVSRFFGSHWYYQRPSRRWGGCSYIANSVLGRYPLEVLAWTRVDIGSSVIATRELLKRFGLSSVGVDVGGITATVSQSETDRKRIYSENCASAWRIVFNKNFPHQGFTRLWDHPVRMLDLDDRRLNELHNISTWNLTNSDSKPTAGEYSDDD
jgi:hypothetical protein